MYTKNSSTYWVFCNPNNRSLICTQDLTALVNPYFSNNKNTEVGSSDAGVFFFISNWEILKLRIKFPRNFQDSDRESKGLYRTLNLWHSRGHARGWPAAHASQFINLSNARKGMHWVQAKVKYQFLVGHLVFFILCFKPHLKVISEQELVCKHAEHQRK